MVPAAFVVLEGLPLGSNGKVDRRALPSPDFTGDEAEAYVAPRTPAEEIMAGIFAEVLKAERVGARDDFFARGGHSLLATRVISRVRQAFGVELPLRALFEAPSVERLAARVDGLGHAGAGTAAPPLVPRPREGALPLSFAQQRLWFLDQLEPGSTAYHMPYALRLRGALDVPVLERALAEIVRRHETLRTRFPAAGGEPSQVIDPAGPVSIPVQDLRHLTADVREDEARRIAGAEARAPFDLARGPLLRARLLRLADEEHALLFTLHHAVSDGWSTGILVREVSELYGAFSRGEASPLAELPVQYADFAAWQRAWLRDEVLEAQLDYWRTALAGAPPLLELPTDRPRPPVPSDRGASVPFALPAETMRAVQALSRREGATPFMTLLAAWQLLLARYSGQDDVSVGAPVAGRTRMETEGLIGFFVNTLVLRADLSGAPSFRQLLGRVREATLGAHQHQDVPFEKLVEELAPGRSMGQAPLFQVLFVLQNNARELLRLGDLAAEPMAADAESAKFDLTLSLMETEDGLAGSLGYRTELWDAVTAQRMAAHFAALVRAACADPDVPAFRLPMVDDAERAALLGARPAHFPADAALHDLFAAQAARTPDAPALSYAGTTLTYAALDARANQLAHALRGRGVGPEVRVGLYVERSVEMVVGLLGILKAGGAYVPLDVAYPAERIAFMLGDSGVPVLLTQSALVDRLPEHAAEVVRLDADWSDIARESTAAPESGATGDALAYVIYTSGSTGRPKGVLVEHRNVVRLFRATEEWFGFGADDVWTLFHSHAFDFSVWEIWGALLYGGRLAVVPFDVSRDPAAFHRLLVDEGVTVLNQTPSAFQQLVHADADAADSDRLALRTVVFGGEALEPASLRPWFARHGDERPKLVNMYGITETTVHVTYRPLSMADVEAGARSPIGVPIPDLRLVLLDRFGQLVPRGVPGEICVGGAGVARGYLNRPELTAERFIRDPFSEDADARLYRSGDLGRIGADGELEYLGRMDQQVKIRGFRIELGEIEAALLAHPAIREAAVTVRNDVPGDARLVAYVVAREGEDASPAEVRDALRARLPEYMVPSAFVAMEMLPLTGNGKLDRRALPAPEAAPSDAEYVEPRTETERAVAEIWVNVLGVERVGANDDFFTLGGHSLRATRVVSHVHRALGAEVAVRALFESPTLAGFAEQVDRAAGTAVPETGLQALGGTGATLAVVDEMEEDELDRLLRELAMEEEEAEW
jgi:amino acid adenylation domain-containing protein